MSHGYAHFAQTLEEFANHLALTPCPEQMTIVFPASALAYSNVTMTNPRPFPSVVRPNSDVHVICIHFEIRMEVVPFVRVISRDDGS